MRISWRLWAAISAGVVALAAAWMVGPDLGGLRPDTAESRVSALLGPGGRSQKDLVEAEALTRKELAWSPAQPALWARLAQIHSLRVGQLDVEAVALLERSYALSPYDSELVLWRTAFTYDHWRAAPQSLRLRARDEAAAFYTTSRDHTSMDQLLDSVHDPAGRLALSLTYDSAVRHPRRSTEPSGGLSADSPGGKAQ